MGTAIKHLAPDQVKPSFVIFDIRALWRPALTRSGTGCFMYPYDNRGRQMVKPSSHTVRGGAFKRRQCLSVANIDA